MEASYERTRYVLVIRVPREVEICLEDRFLGLLGTTKPVMGYHISLVGSFFMPGDVGPEALTGIAELCRRYPAFHVEMEGLGGFTSQGSTIAYMYVTTEHPLLELQRDLADVLESQIEYVNETVREWNVVTYRPHITLGLGLSDGQFEALQRSAADGGCSAAFEVAAISLVGKEPNGPWQHLATYPLKPTDSVETGQAPESTIP